MTSTIRNIRDQRINVRTSGERRGPVEKFEKQKTYDSRFTTHSTSTKPPALDGEPSQTDHKVDAVHEVITGQLAPRTQTKSRNAVLSDRRDFYYYVRKRTGRRCSCFDKENSPEGQCAICLGTGIVGGYEKFGTITEVLDFTSPNLVMVNCEPNFDHDTRPVFLRLKEGYKYGYIEATLPIKNNIREIDTYMLFQPCFNRGTKLIATDPMGGQAEIKSKEDLAPFLLFDRVKIKIEITKKDEKPIISHFMMRYRIKDVLSVPGDIPRSEEDLVLTNLGMHDSYQEISIFFDGRTVTRYHNEDVLVRLSDKRKFKIVMVNENRWGGVLTSTDVRARYLIEGLDHINKTLLV
jgi:hypothetical protein